MRLFPDARADELGEDGLTGWVRSYLTARMGRDPGDAIARELLRSYVKAGGDTSRAKGSDHWAAIQTDGIMRQPVIRVADSRAASAPTFVYQFDWAARRAGADLGAFHAIELPFVFDAFDVDGWDAFVGVDAAGRRLGYAMRSAWAAFAATGDPSGGAVGEWPPYEEASRPTMILDEACHVVSDPLVAERSWWDGLWSADGRPAGVPQ
jgi:carboxylesterase type B